MAWLQWKAKMQPLPLCLHVLVLLLLACSMAGMPAAASAEFTKDSYAVANLPRKPEVVCASQEVYNAFKTCHYHGKPTEGCCSGLDAVYANSSSPAHGCLCLPFVLYRTVLRAAEDDVDVLGILRRCRLYQQSFQVQWADTNKTLCPKMRLATGPVQLLGMLGPAHLLTGDRPMWAWSNLLQAGDLLQQFDNPGMFAEDLLGKQLMQGTLMVLAALPLLFLVMHHGVLRPFSRVYRRLPIQKQMVTCQHAMLGLVFGASLVPQTLLACRFMFGAWTGEILAARLLTTLNVYAMSRSGLYLIEAAVRVIHWSGLLVSHHVMNLFLVTMMVWSGDPAVAVIGVVLDLFSCYEAPLYAALIAYRLEAPARLARRILHLACGWFIATRVLQVVILAYMIGHLATLPVINRDPVFIITTVMCVAVTIIQVYTLLIYAAVDKKLAKRVAAELAAKHQAQSVDRHPQEPGSPQSTDTNSLRRRSAIEPLDAVHSGGPIPEGQDVHISSRSGSDLQPARDAAVKQQTVGLKGKQA